MDQKYLAEIKARYELGRPVQQREVKALLAEVERLKKDRDNLKAQLDMYGGDEGITSALQEAVDCRKEAAAANLEKAKLNRQIATLGKALEIASEEVNKAFETLESHHVITMTQKASGIQENVDTWILQAQEQEGKK